MSLSLEPRDAAMSRLGCRVRCRDASLDPGPEFVEKLRRHGVEVGDDARREDLILFLG